MTAWGISVRECASRLRRDADDLQVLLHPTLLSYLEAFSQTDLGTEAQKSQAVRMVQILGHIKNVSEAERAKENERQAEVQAAAEVARLLQEQKAARISADAKLKALGCTDLLKGKKFEEPKRKL